MARIAATAVARRPAHGSAQGLTQGPVEALWLAPLPTGVDTDRTPVSVNSRSATGEIRDLAGAVTDMAFSRDGRVLVAAHYGADAVSLIDTANLTLTDVIGDIAEPAALAAGDRAYVSSAAVADDSVVAVDLATGVALAAREVGATARGLAISPAGDTLYVSRCADTADSGPDAADIAVIGVESGRMATIPVARGADATVGAVRISPDGSRLYALLTTAAGSAVAIIDTRSRRVLRTVSARGSLGDVAVSRDGSRVAAAGWDPARGGTVTIIDAAAGRAVATVAISGQPTQVVIAGNRAYVAHGETVTVIDVASARVVDSSTAASTVSCIAVSPDETVLYVADFEGVLTATSLAGARLRAAS